jgi:hypothetical protein
LFPEKSLENWSIANCAECDALNKALKDGVKLEKDMHTVKINRKTGKITDFKRCENCKVTTKEVKKVTSD